MTLRRIWPALAGVALVLGFLHLLGQRGREYERLQHATDSLNISIKAYQADSARRQTAIDSALQVAATAESIAARAGRSATRSARRRDSLLIVVAGADTGDVPRALFEAVVGADSAVIRDQQRQIAGLETALSHVYVAFHEADSARLKADTLLRDMRDNRDEWRSEAKRANRIGLLVGFGWTAPSGQWQAMIGVGKRIRLPGFLGGL